MNKKLAKPIKIRTKLTLEDSADETLDYYAKLAAAIDGDADSDAKIKDQKIRNVLNLIEKELRRATSLHGGMRSVHEGYAVLLEEVDELWDEVKKKTKNRSDQKMEEEAVQVAAMAARFVVDLLNCQTKRGY